MDIGLSMSMGGSFYRATQNAEKVNKAVNSMLNRLETGEKYQYVHENVAAMVEGATLKSKVNSNDIASDRNSKNQTELESYMSGQKKLLESFEALKEVKSKYDSLSATEKTATQGLALVAQGDELGKAIDALSTSVKFGSVNLIAGGNVNLQVNALTDGNYTAAMNAITITAINAAGSLTTGAAFDTALDAAITNLAKNSAITGVVYNNVLGAQKDVMTGIINASSQRYSSLIAADDNETSALLNVLNSRAGAIQAAKQYAGQYAGNAIQLTNLLA